MATSKTKDSNEYRRLNIVRSTQKNAHTLTSEASTASFLSPIVSASRGRKDSPFQRTDCPWTSGVGNQHVFGIQEDLGEHLQRPGKWSQEP